MTPTTQRGSNAFVATSFAIALAMFGCDSSSPSRANGVNNAKPDGGGSTPETGAGDAPLGGGGGIQGGGGSAGGGKTSGGGSGGSTASGTVGGYGGALGGSAGTIRPAGGAGGAVAGLGGAGGQVSSGAGGRVGAGGTPMGQGGGYGPDAGRGGAGGSVDAPIGGNRDAAAREVMWWENDAGIKACPYYFGDYIDRQCLPGGPSICVVAGTYNPYQCNASGRWTRQPDPCPRLLVNGDTCTGQFACLYPSFWYCDCSAGMGFPAKCGDVRETGLLDPRDAAPPVDTRPAALLACPADYRTGTCDQKVQWKCVQEDGNTVCMCQVSGTWRCSSAPCSAPVAMGDPCDPSLGATYCRSDSDGVCTCTNSDRATPTIGIFLCIER